MRSSSLFHALLPPDIMVAGLDITVDGAARAGGWWIVVAEHPQATPIPPGGSPDLAGHEVRLPRAVAGNAYRSNGRHVTGSEDPDPDRLRSQATSCRRPGRSSRGEPIPAEVRDRATRRDAARPRASETPARRRPGAVRVDRRRSTKIDRADRGSARRRVLELSDPWGTQARRLAARAASRATRDEVRAENGHTTLRVRIYPDEVHVDDLVRGLTSDEAEAGKTYWTAIWPEPPAEDAWRGSSPRSAPNARSGSHMRRHRRTSPTAGRRRRPHSRRARPGRDVTSSRVRCPTASSCSPSKASRCRAGRQSGSARPAAASPAARGRRGQARRGALTLPPGSEGHRL